MARTKSKIVDAKDKKKRGRPSIDREEALEKLKPYFERGATFRQACIRSGINYNTAFEWLSDESFSNKIKYYEDLFLFICEKTVAEEIIKNKNAELALKVLERRDKQKYSTRQEVTGAGGGAIEQKIVNWNL